MHSISIATFPIVTERPSSLQQDNTVICDIKLLFGSSWLNVSSFVAVVSDDGFLVDFVVQSLLLFLCSFSHFQIRVVNAFRMGLDADSFDKRSLSSLQSQHSLQNLRMQVLKKSTSYDADAGYRAGAAGAAAPSPHYPGAAEARVWETHWSCLIHPTKPEQTKLERNKT